MNKVFKEENHCHSCNTYQVFTWHLDLEGRQECPCPNCGHLHHRLLTEDDRAKLAFRYNKKVSV